MLDSGWGECPLRLSHSLGVRTWASLTFLGFRFPIYRGVDDPGDEPVGLEPLDLLAFSKNPSMLHTLVL